MHRWLRIGLFGAVGGALAIQLVPYGREHRSEQRSYAVTQDAEADRLFREACADCHSYGTAWPWYSNIAPVSWLVQLDVDRGRDAWNASEDDDWDDGAEEVAEGSMPPRRYELAHPEARLSDEERAHLASALEALDERLSDR